VHDVVGTERGRESLGIGAGGDRTAVVHRIAEDAVIARCEALHAQGLRFLLRSEELGEREYGARQPVLLVDPVDGSINAKQGVPFHCTSLALVDGETFGDTVVGVVRSLAGPGMYSAVRGAGAWRDGRPLQPLEVALQGGRISVLVVEGVHRPELLLAQPDLLRACVRVRLLGAAALSLCQAASGAASAVACLAGLRSFDCAAGLLLLAESGAVVTDREGRSLDGEAADMRSRVAAVASQSREVHQTVLSLLH
jgi:myo-inositol-1(or 4)-monophosphatase